MKVTVDIDCTPEEARRFLGLPDVTALQEAMIEEMQRRLREGLSAADAEALMRAWMPLGQQGWEQLQSMFWPPRGGTTGKDDKK